MQERGRKVVSADKHHSCVCKVGTVKALGAVKLFEHIRNSAHADNTVVLIKLDNKLCVKLHERYDSGRVAKSHMSRNAKTERVEKRKNDDFGLLAGNLNLINIAHFVNKLVYSLVCVHNGFAFAGGAAAVEINGDVRSVVLHTGNAFACIFLQCRRIAFAIFNFWEDCLNKSLSKPCCSRFHGSGVIGISAKQNGNAELVECFNMALDKQIKDHDAL